MKGSRAVTAARILETVENYARVEIRRGVPPAVTDSRFVSGDDDFWHRVLQQEIGFGTPIDFPYDVAISEWVARVPGLFWTPSAQALRDAGEKDVESQIGNNITLTPFGKSQVVGGGIGTLRLPPSPNGDRIATIVISGNVSAGIPALISDDVWNAARLQEGSVVELTKDVVWQAMDASWAERFPSTRGIPRGYLRLDDPKTVRPSNERAPTEIHPFSIMEYASNNIALFDFVYATARTSSPGYRQRVENFFGRYCQKYERNGRYLIDADIAQPMWESEFASPEQLKRDAQYHLLLRRIEESLSGKDTIEFALRVLCNTDRDLLRRFSLDIGIPPALWFRDGSLAEESANLLEKVTPDKLPLLLDSISALNPHYLEV